MSSPPGGDLAAHRARRRQRALDRLREAAETSDSARRLLARADPDGCLRYTDENGDPITRDGHWDRSERSPGHVPPR